MIRRCLERVRGLNAASDGTMAIETAIVAPVMILLAFGSFQVSSMVARHTELQTAAEDAAAIALAAPPESQTDLARIKNIILASTNLEADEVSLSFAYRCDDAEATVTTQDECNEEAPIWSYMQVSLDTHYVPIWTQLGVGAPVNLKVQRSVAIS